MYFTNDLSMIDHDAKDPNTLRFKKMKTSIVQRKRTIKYWFRVCGRWFAARAAQFSMVLCHETRNMESDNTAMIYFIKFFHLQQAFFVSERKKKQEKILTGVNRACADIHPTPRGYFSYARRTRQSTSQQQKYDFLSYKNTTTVSFSSCFIRPFNQNGFKYEKKRFFIDKNKI